ncbi:MAG TPA: serine/threonine-protein kinase [Actinomycetota bacterium]|nr:serine/threonine-protein kinase [Actinomycetota bacterium]
MKAEQRVQGRYVLVEPLGRGGMAEVWLARDERLERDVAVKFMAPNLCGDPEFLVRFFSEAQAVARISHPNVVAVLDFGDFEDRPYLVMECVPGGPLSALTGEPMLPERAVEIVAGAARGAGAAHGAGLVHRDLKPGNILLDESGAPKLADFGIASSARSERLTATGAAIGSPHYVSPEQASGRAVTPASDVYSLGAVLYELLTGAPPFDADNVTAIAIAHVEQPPVPPSARVDALPEHLDAIVLSCLAKDPASRPPDGAALADALEGAEPATSWIPAVTDDNDDDPYEYEESEEPRVKKRWLVPALVAASLLLALAGTIYVSGRPEDVAEAGTDRPPRASGAEETNRPRKPTPSPTVEASSAPVAVPVTTPTPTATPEPEEESTPTPEPREEEDDGPLWTPIPDEEPEPTPEPTEEPAPSEEPTPSEEPAPSEEPGT